MKTTVIGSGSIFFTRQCVKGMAQSKALRSSELALVDIDPRKAEQMGRFCQKINRDHGGDLRISWTTDRREALPGSDYVVLCFAVRNYHYRETGTSLALNYGIRLVSGETAGPSMVFRTMRTVPRVLEVAKDIEALCPKSFVINYVNPTNIIGTALDRHTKLRSYAFCDGNYETLVPRLARVLGIRDPAEAGRRLAWKLGGINHFTFLTALSDEGKDVWEVFKERLEAQAASAGVEDLTRAEWEMTSMFDAFPTQMAHPVEYLRYFQGRGSRPSRDFRVAKWSLNKRIRWYRGVWREIEECNRTGHSTRELMKDASTDMVAVVIESMEADLGLSICVNVRNEGRITNLPDDVIVELYGTFGRGGPVVPPFGPLPRGVLGMTQQVIDEQELALEAAMTGSFDTAVRAIACDPLVMSLSDARDLARELIAVEEDDLDRKWDDYWATTTQGAGGP
jgi:alpha-galactosidase/6-phospho-beta-glucosidase family protein